MILYGTTTSPFVRRVRVVAAELGVSFAWVDAFTEDGQARMRQRSPIWKVPVVEIDGRTLIDSRVIVNYLFETRGRGPFRVPRDPWEERNLCNVVDGALESSIHLFYLEREGADPNSLPYLRKQRDRTKNALAHLASRLDGGYFTADHALGVSELALVTALDWMQFRKTFDASELPPLVAFLAEHADRKSLVETRPKA
jgi:glutathione S-transferase